MLRRLAPRPKQEKKPSHGEEAQRLVQEEIDQQRAILEDLRRKMN